MNQIDLLNQSFAVNQGEQSVYFETEGMGIPVLHIKNQFASAILSLQGAQLLSWEPSGSTEVIFVSKDAVSTPGKSIRGGIPVCWPWFGVHKSSTDFPAHGFARNCLWDVTAVEVADSGVIQVRLRLDTCGLTESLHMMWPTPATLYLEVTLSNSLGLTLITVNHADVEVEISQALHTYFRVEDIARVKVLGLEGKTYLDKTDYFNEKYQSGAICIDGEVDRIYLDTLGDVVIDDGSRRILVQRQGSRSTVVWNPGEAVATKMGDMGSDGYRYMVCVETANAANDTVTLAPGQQYTMATTYSLVK